MQLQSEECPNFKRIFRSVAHVFGGRGIFILSFTRPNPRFNPDGIAAG